MHGSAEEINHHSSQLPADTPWAIPSQDIFDHLKTSEEGLGDSEAKKRRRRYGSNRLRVAKRKSAWMILLDQFKNFIVLLLAAAAVLSFAFGQWLEGASILVALVVNAVIGFFTELKAVRSMESLQRLSRVDAKVRRDGQIIQVPAEELVPGDVVFLEGGDIVSADLRLIEAARLSADESALTGESVSVSKVVEPLKEDVPLAERKNMLFKGSAVTEGSGEGIVVATGMKTELGRISSLAEEAEEEISPLEKRLNRLGHRLIWITLAIAGLVAASGIIAGKQTLLIIETAIALAVAAIPEGLPIVATIALARGMWRMANHNAVMNRLSAVETLGATSVICSDKTGTLTQNRMTVTRIVLAASEPEEIEEIEIKESGTEDEATFLLAGNVLNPSDNKTLQEILEVGVLCNNADLDKDAPGEQDKAVGDPLEIALLTAGVKAGIHREKILDTMPEEREEAFDPQIAMMATFHRNNGRYRVAVKGAPEAVVERCTHIRTRDGDREMTSQHKEQWVDCNNRLAENGLRVLGLATKTAPADDVEPYEGLTFLGLFGLFDPPRREVTGAIRSCKDAGIRVIMVTGDQAITAKSIGRSVGLIEGEDADVMYGKNFSSPDDMSEEARDKLLQVEIFSRVDPKQKLDIIALHQRNGAVVAMTGDGVNDAPALKKADIGVAMGKGGTQVAREAADMVLKDNGFNTIVVAIEQGRAIFDNLRKFILFLLSGNVAEIMIVAFALLAGAPLPIFPLQILYLNMIGDVFPALALGVGKGDPSKMNHPPRNRKEPILTRSHWLTIGGYGLILAFAVLGAFALALNWLHLETREAVSISFLTLAFARLWHVFNMRDPGSTVLRNDVTRNPFVWGALALCVFLLLAGVYVPGLSLVLKLVDPGSSGWALILAMSLLPLLVGQLVKLRTAR